MSSSGDGPGDGGLTWDQFDEREVALEVELASPAADVAALLRRYRADVDAVEAEVVAARREGVEALARQAVMVVQLETALALHEPKLVAASLEKVHRHLRILKDRMLDELAAAGVELVRLAGRAYDDVAGLVDVEGWLHRDDLESEVVLEELEPAVRHGGDVIHLGRVVMGAPLRAAPPEEPTAAESQKAETDRGHGRAECQENS